jgi:hypothetical protein
MATTSRELLSGSTDGAPIKIAATATPGTLLHTAHATSKDEIWIWINNTSGVAVNLTVEFGGTTDPDHLVPKTASIPANSVRTIVLDGATLTNSKAVRAFAQTANVLLATGHINRIA